MRHVAQACRLQRNPLCKALQARTPALRVLAAGAILVNLALCACGTPPQEHFYTLASDPLPQRATTATTSTYTVVVGPVTVPELVDRPQLVVRTSPTRVDIVELARWAAPLKSEIPRVVADQLARLLDGAHTSSSWERTAGAPDYRVLIDIHRFESAPQEGATVQASWTISSRDGTSIGGQSAVTEAAGGAGYDALVAAHSRALASISRDIAAAISDARKTR